MDGRLVSVYRRKLLARRAGSDAGHGDTPSARGACRAFESSSTSSSPPITYAPAVHRQARTARRARRSCDVCWSARVARCAQVRQQPVNRGGSDLAPGRTRAAMSLRGAKLPTAHCSRALPGSVTLPHAGRARRLPATGRRREKARRCAPGRQLARGVARTRSPVALSARTMPRRAQRGVCSAPETARAPPRGAASGARFKRVSPSEEALALPGCASCTGGSGVAAGAQAPLAPHTARFALARAPPSAPRRVAPPPRVRECCGRSTRSAARVRSCAPYADCTWVCTRAGRRIAR